MFTLKILIWTVLLIHSRKILKQYSLMMHIDMSFENINYCSVTCWFRICSYFSLYLTLCLSFLLPVLFIIFSTLFVSLLYTKTNIILIDIRNIEPILFSEVMLRIFLWSTMSTLFHFTLDMLLLNMSCKLWYFVLLCVMKLLWIWNLIIDMSSYLIVCEKTA